MRLGEWCYMPRCDAERGLCGARARRGSAAVGANAGGNHRDQPDVKANETMPIDHTADGKNVSPALAWSGAPAATKQFALV